MEEKQIAEGNIGTVGKYDVDFKEGKLVVAVNANEGASSADLTIKIDAKQVLDKICEKIPGQVDDVIIGILEKALGLS